MSTPILSATTGMSYCQLPFLLLVLPPVSLHLSRFPPIYNIPVAHPYLCPYTTPSPTCTLTVSVNLSFFPFLSFTRTPFTSGPSKLKCSTEHQRNSASNRQFSALVSSMIQMYDFSSPIRIFLPFFCHVGRTLSLLLRLLPAPHKLLFSIIFI